MLFEWDHQMRRIYTDGRKMPDGYPPSYMGYSTGKWDGDTLVVETVGLNDLPGLILSVIRIATLCALWNASGA
jgi:hypothetical protein